MFFKKKGQIIRFEQNLCNARIDDNEVLFVRVGDVVKAANARFEVPYTHDAIVIKGGGDLRLYRSGTYDVFSDRREAKRWKSGISVEIIYIPKQTRVLINWGTPNRMRYRDERTGRVISVGARGEFDVTVTDPERFFVKVVGAKKEFNLEEFKDRFGETVATEFTDKFLKFREKNRLSYDMFSRDKKEIGESIAEELNPIFGRDWGLSVLNFKIADFHLLKEETEAVESALSAKNMRGRISEYLAELERLDDKQWEREKYLRQLELQDKNAYYEVLKVVGGNKAYAETKKNCPNCGIEFTAVDKFCPRCGKRLSTEPIICPICGKSNIYTAEFCSNCGESLTKNKKHM